MEQKSVFIICPVRNLTDHEKRIIENYISNLEREGYNVHYPPRDTNQKDPIGLNITTENREAIKNSDRIDIYWNPKSSGSLFDLGMAFAYKKPIKLINENDVLPTEKKSFENVLLELNKRYNKL